MARPNNDFKPVKKLLTPDQATVQQDSESLERELIFGMVKSCLFYRHARNIVCVYDPEKATHRQDFKIDRYNVLFRALDSWYRRFDARPLENDMGIPPHLLSAYLIDWANKAVIGEDTVTALCEEITNEASLTEEITLDSSLALINSPGFAHWLEDRILSFTIVKIQAQRSFGALTMDNLQVTMQQAKFASQAKQGQNFINAAELMHSRRRFSAALQSDIPKLNDALGGGFRRGEGSLIAGINAGGKTVLMCQLAKTFAEDGNRVALFTTERKPYELLLRIVSNYVNIPMAELINRKEVELAARGEAVEFSTLPEWLWTDPRTKAKMHALEEIVRCNILFVDWAQGQGYSIEKNLDHEIDTMVSLGWNPDAILFDWIGGGLEKETNRDQLRHMYQAGIDALVAHGKRHQRVVVAAAQLNKKLVKATTSYIEMSMLSECQGMTNNISNFIGITSLRSMESIGEKRLQRRQFLTVDKATLGPGGNVQVEQGFEFQRFNGVKNNLISTN